MKYEAPYGVSDPNASYINGDPHAGIAGSIPPAASIENPQREIVNFISDSGLTPTDADLHQLSEAVQSGRVVYGVDVGPVNAVAIALTPILPAYLDGMIFRVKILNGNTGAATFNAGPGPVNIVRRGGAALQAGDLPAGYMTLLIYNLAHNNVELYGVNFQSQTLVPILAGNSNLYVNGSTGSDTLYDGTSATISGSHGPFKTIQHAVDVTFQYGPSVYTMTINVAAGTYPEAVHTPRIVGPSIVINGAGKTQTFVTGANNAHTFGVSNGNTVTVQNLCASTGTGNGPPCAFIVSTGATLQTNNTASGNCACSVFEAYGASTLIPGNHDFNSGSSFLQAYCAYFGGNIFFGANAVVNHLGPVTAHTAYVNVTANGTVGCGAPYLPSFVNAGYVTGYKYYAGYNGVIITEGAGTSFFPGNSFGYVNTGGQYD